MVINARVGLSGGLLSLRISDFLSSSWAAAVLFWFSWAASNLSLFAGKSLAGNLGEVIHYCLVFAASN